MTERYLSDSEQKERFISRRMVVKIGSSTITGGGELLDKNFMKDIARQVSELRHSGVEVIIVSSGAVACGKSSIPNFNKTDILDMRKAAAVGQPKLMAAWADAFKNCEIEIGQLVVTEKDLPMAKDVLEGLLKDGIVPIINANDPVNAYEMEQLSISADNDRLAGFVARGLAADTEVILTDKDGVLDREDYTIPYVDSLEDVRSVIKKESSGVGGMLNKSEAGLEAAIYVRDVFVVNGRMPDVILRAARREDIGTKFGYPFMVE